MMIGWIRLDEASLATIYGIIWSKNMQPGDVSTPSSEEYVAYNAVNYADYVVAASDASSPKKYVVTIPTDLEAEFSHIDFYRQLGASPATTDTWEGMATRVQADVETIEGDAAQQAIADAAKLAPTAGDPAAGSVLSNQATILNRIGAWTGTGVNTILGAFKAILSKIASMPSDIGGTGDPATDSIEAIRDRGDAAWVTATGFATPTNVTDARDHVESHVTTTIQGITQAQRVRVLPPPMMERSDDGDNPVTYRIWIYVYDEQHKAEDLDSLPTVTAENNASVDRSDNLGSVTKPGGTTGIYYVDYSVASAHAVEGLVFKVAATEGTVTTNYAAQSIVVDTTAVDFTAADRLKLETLAADYTSARAVKLDNLDINVGSRSSHSAADVVAALGTGTMLTAIPWNAAWDAEVQSECTDALNAYDPPTNAEMVARTKLTADYADKTTLDAVAVDVAGIDGASVLSASDIRDAVGLAEANLDTKFSALPTAAAIAAAVWAYTTRTLSSFGTLVANVWSYATRTLSSGGVSLAIGPSAYTNARLIPVKVFKNGTAPMCARILASDGGNAQKADVTSITYTIYAVDAEYSGTHPDTWVAVAGHEDVAVAVASVMYDSLQSDYIASNYNFRHTPVVSTNPAFEHIGVPYTVEYKFVMADGSPTVTSRFAVTVI